MKKHIIAASAGALVIGIASIASAAATPCAVSYQHPAKAKSIKSALVQAFVSCNNPGGNTPNATTETGTVPTCYPAETVHQQAGSPPLGWTWGPKSKGDITFKAGKNKVVHPLNTDPNAVDLNIQVKISDIRDNTGTADGTSGSVQSLSRATLIDRAADQLMTVIDFPTGFGITVSRWQSQQEDLCDGHPQQPLAAGSSRLHHGRVDLGVGEGSERQHVRELGHVPPVIRPI